MALLRSLCVPPPPLLQLTHEIQWPNRSPVNRFIMEHQFSFRLPSALLDLYKLGVNTIPSNIDILDVEYEDVHTQDVSTAVLLNSLFNLTWQMPADVQFFTPEYAFNGTRSMLFNSLTALELQELNVWGKGLRQPTLFRFYTEWRNTSKVGHTPQALLGSGTQFHVRVLWVPCAGHVDGPPHSLGGGHHDVWRFGHRTLDCVCCGCGRGGAVVGCSRRDGVLSGVPRVQMARQTSRQTPAQPAGRNAA